MNKNLITIMFCCLPLLAGAQNITFADATVKDICVHNWDTNNDGELSLYEAATVKYLGTVFQYRGDIKQFQELQYFTGLTSIGEFAFYNCSGLTSITIPSSVTSIGSQAFDGCSSLTSVAIPEGVTSIVNAAFYGCSSLTSITISGGVTNISNDAFYGCSSLTSIVVDASNNTYTLANGSNAIIEKATNTLIAGCKNTIIPESVTSIGEFAFYNCSGLTSITIPSSVTSIGWGAFEGCSGLASITIPEGVTNL